MNVRMLSVGAVLACLSFATPQQTPKATAVAYGALADSLLALKKTEEEFVRAFLAGHYRAAHEAALKNDSERAAAEIALFANEGDNAIGGVRNRLLEGGQHHNAEGEAKGIYEPGYVLVTKKMKEEGLAVSASMRQAKTDADRKAAWDRFAKLASALVKEE